MRNLICLVFFGCSSGAQLNITKSVGAEGGTVNTSDGTSVAIPMGALSMASTITITSVDAQAPSGTALVGPAYDFGPDGTTFAQPVTITLPFDSSKLPSGRTSADIAIYTAARGSTNYQLLLTSVSGNTVQTTTSHFTVYVPAAPTGGGPPMDMGTPTCTPSCSAGSAGCDCMEVCSTTTYAMSCTRPTTGPLSCTCTFNGSPANTFTISTCSSGSDAQSAFLANCLG